MAFEIRSPAFPTTSVRYAGLLKNARFACRNKILKETNYEKFRQVRTWTHKASQRKQEWKATSSRSCTAFYRLKIHVKNLSRENLRSHFRINVVLLIFLYFSNSEMAKVYDSCVITRDRKIYLCQESQNIGVCTFHRNPPKQCWLAKFSTKDTRILTVIWRFWQNSRGILWIK